MTTYGPFETRPVWPERYPEDGLPPPEGGYRHCPFCDIRTKPEHCQVPGCPIELGITNLLPTGVRRCTEHVGPPPIERQMGDYVEVTPQRIISMVVVSERTFVATERFVYELVDGVWEPMVFRS